MSKRKIRELNMASLKSHTASAKRWPKGPPPVSGKPFDYMAPVRKWWPDWQSMLEPLHHSATVEAAAKLSRRREHEAKHGIGWGQGTITMAGTPKQPRPGKM